MVEQGKTVQKNTLVNNGNSMNGMAAGQSNSMNRSKSIAPSNSYSNFSQLGEKGDKLSLRNRLTENLLNSSG